LVNLDKRLFQGFVPDFVPDPGSYHAKRRGRLVFEAADRLQDSASARSPAEAVRM
jgi:hypothetical protein